MLKGYSSGIPGQRNIAHCLTPGSLYISRVLGFRFRVWRRPDLVSEENHGRSNEETEVGTGMGTGIWGVGSVGSSLSSYVVYERPGMAMAETRALKDIT